MSYENDYYTVLNRLCSLRKNYRRFKKNGPYMYVREEYLAKERMYVEEYNEALRRKMLLKGELSALKRMKTTVKLWMRRLLKKKQKQTPIMQILGEQR